jgi:RecA/RadA recombinase
MSKLNLQDIVKKTQALYGKDKQGAAMIVTGSTLTRPTKPEEFVVLPKDHPWRALTGLMGLPFNYIVQIAGAYDSGKSTIASEFMVAAQKQNTYVVQIDAEKKFDKIRFTAMGGNPDDILLVVTSTIRKAAGGAFKFIDTIKAADPTAKILLVHDSIGGSVSRARADHAIDAEKENQPGSEAVENSNYMKHLIAYMDKYPDSIAVILLNQMTDKIGFGQKGQSRSGGHKISFHSSLILELKKVKTLTKMVNKVEKKQGIITQVKIDKSHFEQGVYKMNIMVDATGWKETDFSFEKD